MKKAKIMLFSLALLAVLGAAFAFKAKTSSLNWCSSLEVFEPPTTSDCPLFVSQKRTTQVGAAIYATSRIAGLPIINAASCQNPNIVCSKFDVLVDN